MKLSGGSVAGLISFLVIWSSFFGIRLPSARAAATLQIGQNFAGAAYGVESEASPADGDGAVGPNHFAELVNGRFSVYEKATGNRVQTETDQQFWNAAGVTFSSTVGVTDPRIIFDSASQRWFASMVDFVVNRPQQRSNHFLLAVSQSSDPTGKWFGFSLASDTNSLDFADFPTLGVDANGVYLSGDMFDRLGNPVGPTLVAIPKTDLLAIPPTIANRKSFGVMNYASRGDIDQPVIATGTVHSPEVVVGVGDVGLDFQPHTTLVLSTITFEPTNGAVLSSPAVVLNVPAYTVPINPTQPDGSTNLDNGDARFSACVRRVGDVIYATHAVEVHNRSAIRWYTINATNLTVTQVGTITNATLDLFYPSIAANEQGTVVIACNGSSKSQFVSSYAAVGQTTNHTLAFGPIQLLKAGRASYQNPDPSTGISRWGDYSATTVDPVDPSRFWTIQMIPISKSAWGTQITELITGPTLAAPSLTISLAGAQALISWPANAQNYQLQVTISLSPTPIWMAVGGTPSVVNGMNELTVPVENTTSFFRLAPVTAQ